MENFPRYIPSYQDEIRELVDYPTEGARIHAETGKSVWDHILDDANLGEDRTAVALYANYILNTSPGYRPSDAARLAVRRYRIDPDAVRNRNK